MTSKELFGILNQEFGVIEHNQEVVDSIACNGNTFNFISSRAIDYLTQEQRPGDDEEYWYLWNARFEIVDFPDMDIMLFGKNYSEHVFTLKPRPVIKTLWDE